MVVESNHRHIDLFFLCPSASLEEDTEWDGKEKSRGEAIPALDALLNGKLHSF
jgi:hypothetical protein